MPRGVDVEHPHGAVDGGMAASGGGRAAEHCYLSSSSCKKLSYIATRSPIQRDGATWAEISGRSTKEGAVGKSSPINGGVRGRGGFGRKGDSGAGFCTRGYVSDDSRGDTAVAASSTGIRNAGFVHGRRTNGEEREGGGISKRCKDDSTKGDRGGDGDREENGAKIDSRVQKTRIASYESSRNRRGRERTTPPDSDSVRRMESIRRGGGGEVLEGGVKSNRRSYLQGGRCSSKMLKVEGAGMEERWGGYHAWQTLWPVLSCSLPWMLRIGTGDLRGRAVSARRKFKNTHTFFINTRVVVVRMRAWLQKVPRCPGFSLASRFNSQGICSQRRSASRHVEHLFRLR